jgi:hypothetical protein
MSLLYIKRGNITSMVFELLELAELLLQVLIALSQPFIPLISESEVIADLLMLIQQHIVETWI